MELQQTRPRLRVKDYLQFGENAALTAIKVPHEGYIYPNAVHGFNCDATPERFNKAASDLAWQRTVDWFNKYTRA